MEKDKHDICDKVISPHTLKRQIKCDYCDTAFSETGNLKNHINRVHEKVKCVIHKCNQCRKTYSDPGKLKKHIYHMHERVKNHKCHQCGLAFSVTTNLQKHINNVHLGLITGKKRKKLKQILKKARRRLEESHYIKTLRKCS